MSARLDGRGIDVVFSFDSGPKWNSIADLVDGGHPDLTRHGDRRRGCARDGGVVARRLATSQSDVSFVQTLRSPSMVITGAASTSP
jgi:hypothetical protein